VTRELKKLSEQNLPKTEVDLVLVEFDSKEDLLQAFCVRTKNLIEASLQDADIRYESVQFRVKSKKKLKTKYLNPEKDYRKLDDITDLAGLRVITYYEDDLDRVSEVIKREFEVDAENTVDKREAEPDRFGYTAINYVCEHLAKRTSDVEYKKFSGIRCEIQITSILSHAWAEIEHEWYDLKEGYPAGVKRRFKRIAALLELAESEFQDIRKSRTQYERSVAVRVEAKVPDIAVDSVSLKSFIEQEPLVRDIDTSIAALLNCRVAVGIDEIAVERHARVFNQSGITKIQDLRETLEKYRPALLEFVRLCGEELWPARSTYASVMRGVSLFYLNMLVLGERGGVEATLAALRTMMVNKPSWDVSRQVAIAKEVLTKYRAE
jgi:putative GTP pyrophosphokinase